MGTEVDVVIVGGRPAGAALAARLGAQGVKVVIVDRATFPSLPTVPSSPVLYPCAMAMLDELGVEEASYADPHSSMKHFSVNFGEWFSTVMTLPATHGRDYVRGIDRSVFDTVLWDRLERFASVQRRAQFSVRDVVRDEGGRVIGVVGAPAGGEEERITARCVIGADGRYSLIARQVSAPMIEERNQHTSTVYYADWEGVAPTSDGVHGGHLCTNGRGLDILFFAMPGGRFSVNTHSRSDRTEVKGDAQAYYEQTLRSVPEVARRLRDARQVNDVVGIKKIGNAYRQPSGPGWALVGDALHHKDPVDGQGIYDALLEGKLLAAELMRFISGGVSWEAAMTSYGDAVLAATRPMYLATTERLKRELYEEPPVPIIRTAIRWMMSDAQYQTMFLRYLSRDVPPDQWMTPALVAGALARGLGRDVRSIFRR